MRVRIPFGDAFGPRFDAMRTRFAQSSDALGAVLTGDALDGLVAGYANDLARLTTPVLLDEFRRVPGRSWLDPASTVAHDRFVGSLQEGGLGRLFERFPELEVLVSCLETRWADRVEAMVGHIVADGPVLEQRFAVRPPFVAATPVGDTGVVLSDGAGRRVVYKDRRQTMEVAFTTLLGELARRSFSRSLYVPAHWGAEDHGWAEFVTPPPRPDPAMLASQMWEAGLLLAVVHALGGGDLHESNVRGLGPHFVVLDAEKVVRPRVPTERPDEHSVLSSGLLPVAGLFERCGIATGYWTERPRPWANAGTDAVRERPVATWTTGVRERVVRGVRANAGVIAAELTAGFREGYRSIRADGLPLELFAGCRPRVILRNSMHYHRALHRSVQPDALGSAATRTEVFESLARRVPPAIENRPDLADRVGRIEVDALRAGVLPRFCAVADERELRHDDDVIGALFVESGLARARRIVGGMSDAACEAQCRIIDAAVAALASGVEHSDVEVLVARPLDALAG